MKWMTSLVFVLIGVAIIGTGLFRKRALDRLLVKIHKAGYEDHDEQAFLLYVNSPMAKMLVNETTRQFMKLNYYIHKDDVTQVDKIVAKMIDMKMDNKNRQAFYLTTMSYFAQRQDEVRCKNILDLAQQAYGNSVKSDETMVLFDLQLTYDIYIRHDVSKIKGMEHLIDITKDPATRATYLFRLAILYKANGESSKAKDALIEAKTVSTNPQEQTMIQNILDQNLVPLP